jgi:uncharacterized membrane-anchored protein YitT (DUF2179 family)
MRKSLNGITRIAVIIVGSFLAAVAISELIIPHRLLSGGVGGAAIIIQYLTGVSAGILILVINIPIFIFGLRETDRDFIVHSFIGTVSLSLFLIFIQQSGLFSFLRVDDIMLSSIYGGVLNGVGAGLIFRNRGSMGGTDIIAVIIKKHRSINVGTVIFSINVVIICASSLLYGIKPAMYTLISMYLTSAVMDRVQEGFDRKKSVLIISSKEDEVAKAILDNLHRGVTYLYGEGAYTKSSRRIIYCIITTRQLAKLKFIVESADREAFLTVSDASEVLGRGFKVSGI